VAALPSPAAAVDVREETASGSISAPGRTIALQVIPFQE
jgi:hypothetical protein